MRKEGQKIRSCKRNTALLLAAALIAGNLAGNVWGGYGQTARQ